MCVRSREREREREREIRGTLKTQRQRESSIPDNREIIIWNLGWADREGLGRLSLGRLVLSLQGRRGAHHLRMRGLQLLASAQHRLDAVCRAATPGAQRPTRGGTQPWHSDPPLPGPAAGEGGLGVGYSPLLLRCTAVLMHHWNPPPPRPRCTPQCTQVSAGVGKPPHGLGGCIWMPLVNGMGNSPVSGTANPRSSQTGQVIRGLR